MEFLRRSPYLNLILAGGWTLLALVVLWQYDLLGRKLDADASFMLYAGQQILRGYAPYVGVAIVKLPLSPLVAALGIGAGRLVGIEDLIGGRIAFWVCAGLTVGATYLVGAQLLRDPKGFPRDTPAQDASENPPGVLPYLLGSFAAAILLSTQAFGVQVAEGPEAKLPMICAGMFCLVFLARAKFFWAGIAGALSFLAWQPGLIFPAATLICALVVKERKRALLMSVAGIAAPLVVVGGYVALNGALGSMFRQAFGANANYFGEKKAAANLPELVIGNLLKVWQVAADCSPAQVPLMVLGFAGIVGGVGFLIYQFRKTGGQPFFLAGFPLFISGAALFGFSLLDLQKCSDLTPLLPYMALGAGAVLLFGVVLVARVTNPRVSVAVGIVLIAAILLFGARTALGQSHQTGLAQQRALAKQLTAQLQPTDSVQQFGDTVVLVLTGRENATRFVHLGEKQGLGILTAEGISMQDLIARLRAANPRVITLSRAKNKDWAQPLYDWLESAYRLDSTYGASEGGTLKETDVYWLK